MGGVPGFFGISKKGKDMSPEDLAKESKAQADLDKLVTGPKAFGNRTMSASEAEKQMRAAGTLPEGWRLRESDSTSSGYRPTPAKTKTAGAISAGQIAAAVGTGGLSLPVQAAISGGLGAAGGLASGGGLKGALLGGALGAAGPYVPGGATASLGRKVATQAGMGAAQGLASGGGWKGALLGAGAGAAGAKFGNVGSKLTGNALGQKAINFGIGTGLDTVRSGGQFNPRQLLMNAGGNFLPDAANRMTGGNTLANRAINYGGNLALNQAGGGRFDPVQAGRGALSVLNPQLSARIEGNPGMKLFDQFQGLIPGRAAGGPVRAGRPYKVGEQGEETFVPNQNGTIVPNEETPNFWDKYGGAITTIGGGIGGMIASKKAQDAAAQRSPDEQAAINAVMGPNGAAGVGQSLMQESRPYIGQPASYYQTLLHGNRAAMANATAAPRAALNEQFRGAQTGLARSGIRGAARDQLAGNLEQQRAGQVAGLTTGVQPGAAAALAGLGQDLQKNAVPLYQSSNSFYQQMLQNGLANRINAQNEGAATGKEIGGMVEQLSKLKFGKGKAPASAPPLPGVNLPPKGPQQGGVLTGPGGFTLPQPGVLQPPPPSAPMPGPIDSGQLPGQVPMPQAPRSTGDYNPWVE